MADRLGADVKIYLVSFATAEFRASQHRLAESAKRSVGVDEVVLWDHETWSQLEFFRRHREVAGTAVGAGYWLWKPYIILDLLRRVAVDDVVVYCDAGRRGGYKIRTSLAPLVDWVKSADSGFLPGCYIPEWGPNKKWTRRDCFVYMNCDEPKYWDHCQIQATFSVWRRTARSLSFLQEWLDCCCDARLVSENANVCGLPNLDGFIAHRHDQSILTNLAIKHDIVCYGNPGRTFLLDRQKDINFLIARIRGDRLLHAELFFRYSFYRVKSGLGRRFGRLKAQVGWTERGREVATNRAFNRRPRITIIVACLNAAAYIDHCLESIAGQDYPDLEVVVVDGASNDGTVDILGRYADLLGGRVDWISEPDRGIADAWNKAVKRASGDWLLFMGADDALSAPNVLSLMEPWLVTAFPDHAIVYGIVAMTDRAGRVIEYLDRPWTPTRFRNCIENLPHPSVFHHRSLFDRHGSFDASFKVTLDYDFLLRELMTADPLRIEEIVVTNAQIGGISTDYRHRLRAVSEHIRLCHRHIGQVPPVMYWWVAKAWGSWLLYQIGGGQLVFRATNFYRRLVHGRPPQRR
jgi:glycosyltransferase involved in cell wall biosynthesis